MVSHESPPGPPGRGRTTKARTTGASTTEPAKVRDPSQGFQPTGSGRSVPDASRKPLRIASAGAGSPVISSNWRNA